MEQQPNPEILHWHNLSAEDVYHLAHLEDETRDLFATQASKIEINVDFTRETLNTALHEALNSETALGAQDMVKNYESYAQSWLGSQALARGLRTETPIVPVRSAQKSGRSRSRSRRSQGKVVNSEWFREQLDSIPDLSGTKLAERVGVSAATISGLKNGKNRVSSGLSKRIVDALADHRGLEGEERQAFIASSVSPSE